MSRLNKILSHLVLIIVSLLSVFPFLWLLSTALKGNAENIFAYPPNLIPKCLTFKNFIDVWNQIPFVTYFINSFIVAIFTVILNLFFSSLAAYPLARMEFWGKKTIFDFTICCQCFWNILNEKCLLKFTKRTGRSCFD